MREVLLLLAAALALGFGWRLMVRLDGFLESHRFEDGDGDGDPRR